MSNKVCAVLGAGPGNGAAIASKFADKGYVIALCARNEERLKDIASGIASARIYTYDVRDVGRADAVFTQIESELGPVDTIVYNAGQHNVHWLSRWQSTWGQRRFMWPMSSSMGWSISKGPANRCPTRRTHSFSSRPRSQMPCTTCLSSRSRPGRSNSICGHLARNGDGKRSNMGQSRTISGKQGVSWTRNSLFPGWLFSSSR